MFASGNLPTWSADTIFVTFKSFLCLFRAFKEPPWKPETITSESSLTFGVKINVTFTSDSLITFDEVSKPTYDTVTLSLPEIKRL